MTIRSTLSKAKKRCIQHDLPESYAKYILNELFLKQDRNLYDELDKVLDEPTATLYESILVRLEHDEPLAYVMGEHYFYGYRFDVNPNVLIPRYETEELVLRVLMEMDEYFESDALTVLDIGTGSGAIACVLKKESPNLTVYASDISEEALIQAKHNAKSLEADVTFYQGDMGQPFVDRGIKADVIVCNPPYIPQDEEIQTSVKNFEPHVALFGGEDGLYFYRKVLNDAQSILKDHSILAFEMGWNQKENLSKEVRKVFPNAQIEGFKDMQGKDRILVVRLG